MLTARAIDFLEGRLIDTELAVRLGLKSLEKAGGGEEIVFPYLVGTEAVNHKYRGIDDKRFRQDAGATKCFWNFNAILDPELQDQPLIITEGEFDAMAVMQAGFMRVVSVPDGAPKEAIGGGETTKYGYLDHAAPALRGVKEIILATDGDGPGIALMNDLSLRLDKTRCKWVQYPKAKGRDTSLKDMNEVWAQYGEKGIRAVIERAAWCHVDGIYRMSELPPYDERPAVSTGMPFLDPHYKVRTGDLCVITGVPGYGKSTFVNDVCCRLVAQYGWNVAFASFEQHPQADHRRALREWYNERKMAQCTPQKIREADAWIDGHFVFIQPSDNDLANLKWTLEKCAAAAMRFEAKVLVIDPWNELDHDRPSDMSLTEYTGRAIKEFKRLARKFDVHIMLVAHPTKLQNVNGEVICPTMYDISDSSHWYNKPDVGIIIHKNAPGDTVAMCRVAKSRYHEQIGVPGTVWMEYDRNTRRFSQAPNIDDAPPEQHKRRSKSNA